MSDPLQIRQHYWAPYLPMVRVVETIAEGKERVLEIGPGKIPFSAATESVDWQAWDAMSGKKVHVLDINQDTLPFPDKSFDFVYCRHTLEDLYNPFHVWREMSRVAKAGPSRRALPRRNAWRSPISAGRTRPSLEPEARGTPYARRWKITNDG